MSLPEINSIDLETVRGATAPRVVFPWTPSRVRWEALDAIRKQYPAVLPVQLGEQDASAYSWLVLALCELRQTFVICEHDVVPPNGSIRRLLSCKAEWCTHTEPYNGIHPTDTFGLVKISGELLTRWPDVGEYAAFPMGRHRGIRTWEAIAANVSHRLRQHGLEPHVHQPALRHLHIFEEG